MASHKNQHYVPRCYLRPFTLNCEDRCINLFNVDRQLFVRNAPVKHQCSSDYFYGADGNAETALGFTETAYAEFLRQVLEPRYILSRDHSLFLARFWLLQRLRTQAAAFRQLGLMQRAANDLDDESLAVGFDKENTTRMLMRIFVEAFNVMDDMSVVLVRNRTTYPFVTSDNPAILTGRWCLSDKRMKNLGIGFVSSGILLFLPITPEIFMIGYDKDVYSISKTNGWTDITRTSDILALNEHQYLNCAANIYVRDDEHAEFVEERFGHVTGRRPTEWFSINYAALLEKDETRETYVQAENARQALDDGDGTSIMQSQQAFPAPSSWPSIVRRRANGRVYLNGTATGCVRRARIDPNSSRPYRKARAYA